MQVDGDIKRLGRFKDGPKLFVIEIFASRVGVDDRSLQAELPHAALQLLDSCAGILRRDCG